MRIPLCQPARPDKDVVLDDLHVPAADPQDNRATVRRPRVAELRKRQLRHPRRHHLFARLQLIGEAGRELGPDHTPEVRRDGVSAFQHLNVLVELHLARKDELRFCMARDGQIRFLRVEPRALRRVQLRRRLRAACPADAEVLQRQECRLGPGLVGLRDPDGGVVGRRRRRADKREQDARQENLRADHLPLVARNS